MQDALIGIDTGENKGLIVQGGRQLAVTQARLAVRIFTTRS